MKIHTLKYKDHVQKWEINKTSFFDLTLLVGISGVGKTQILHALLQIRSIAYGGPDGSGNGVEWEIVFSNEQQNYLWTGKFEAIEDPFFTRDILNTNSPHLEKEALFLNGDLIIERKNGDILFKGSKMPKLSSKESVISIFKEEDSIQAAYNGFKKMVFRDHTMREGEDFSRYSIFEYEQNKTEFQTIDAIRNSGLDTISKLFCLHANEKEIFNELVDNYKDIFPQVEQIRIGIFSPIPFIANETPNIQFKEKGVDKWISQSYISSGMFRTFLHISEMYLLSDGTVVLIDEFENSLGVNCINVLTEDLIHENNRLQFIATSHHPYIINKIPYDYWKIVTRRGGTINTSDAKDFELGRSNHERFLNLINLPQYKSGIESFS